MVGSIRVVGVSVRGSLVGLKDRGMVISKGVVCRCHEELKALDPLTFRLIWVLRQSLSPDNQVVEVPGGFKISCNDELEEGVIGESSTCAFINIRRKVEGQKWERQLYDRGW